MKKIVKWSSIISGIVTPLLSVAILVKEWGEPLGFDVISAFALFNVGLLYLMYGLGVLTLNVTKDEAGE